MISLIFKENNSINTPFEYSGKLGYLNIKKHRIPVIKEDDKYYILHHKTREIVCKTRYIDDKFAYEGRVLWIKSERDKKHNMMVNRRGKYLIDIRTANFIEVPKPEKVENGCFFLGDNKKVRWDGYKFDMIDTTTDEDNKVEDTEKNIEDFLQDVDLKFGKPSDRVDDVKTPVPLAEIFERLAEGNIEDGSFVPPSQREYANYGYVILKNQASEDQDMFSEEYKKDWKRRLRVAWTSLVRDSQFAAKIQNNQENFDCITHSREQDLKGADTIIIDDETEYHINLFVDSEKSNKYLRKKKSYRQNNEIIIDDKADKGPVNILVPIDVFGDGPKDTVKSNNNRDIYLYSDKHIDGIRNLIKNNKQEFKDENGNLICKKQN